MFNRLHRAFSFWSFISLNTSQSKNINVSIIHSWERSIQICPSELENSSIELLVFGLSSHYTRHKVGNQRFNNSFFRRQEKHI